MLSAALASTQDLRQDSQIRLENKNPMQRRAVPDTVFSSGTGGMTHIGLQKKKV